MFEQLENFISAELESRNHTGSSVAVVIGTEIVWMKGFGYRDMERKVCAGAETVYRCASVTKPVVTTGFLQLMERGKFNLDDSVNRHLDVKIQSSFEKEPTIRDLLTHHSGLPTRVPPIFCNRAEALRLREYIAAAARTVQSPRKSYAYCNTAFTIIGHLIELLSGVRYDRYLKENVLKPLEMSSSEFESTETIEKLLAQGYDRAGGPDEPIQPVKPYINGTSPEDPCGSLFSSVTDLSHFLIAHMNKGTYKGQRILRSDTIEMMHELHAGAGGSRSGMALSWFRNIHDGHVMLSHTGGLPGYTNHVAFYPDRKIGVSWLSNLDDGTSWRPPAPTALRIVAEDIPLNAKTLQTVPAEWRRLIGKYGKPGQAYSVRVKNGYLVLEDGGGAVFLERVSESRYVVHGAHHEGYELTFEFDQNGEAKLFDLENQAVSRYAEESVVADEKAVLVGSWSGEYVHPYGFFNLSLDIRSTIEASASDMDGNKVPLRDFKAEKGRVTGTYEFLPSRDYQGWRAGKYQVKLDLAAVDGQLKGSMSFSSKKESGRLAVSLTLKRA